MFFVQQLLAHLSIVSGFFCNIYEKSMIMDDFHDPLGTVNLGFGGGHVRTINGNQCAQWGTNDSGSNQMGG